MLNTKFKNHAISPLIYLTLTLYEKLKPTNQIINTDNHS